MHERTALEMLGEVHSEQPVLTAPGSAAGWGALHVGSAGSLLRFASLGSWGLANTSVLLGAVCPVRPLAHFCVCALKIGSIIIKTLSVVLWSGWLICSLPPQAVGGVLGALTSLLRPCTHVLHVVQSVLCDPLHVCVCTKSVLLLLLCSAVVRVAGGIWGLPPQAVGSVLGAVTPS